MSHRLPDRLLLGSTLLVTILVAPSAADPVWQALPNAPVVATSRFDDVWFIDERMGWTGWGSHVYRTTDGGSTWQDFNAPVQHVRCIAFATAEKGWIGSIVDSTALLATTDGGATWRPVDLPEPRPRGICGLSIVDQSVVYGSGSITGVPTVVKSVDGGASWRSIDLSAVATGLVDCHFFAADSGFVVGRVETGALTAWRPVVLCTVDGGTTWETRYTGTSAGSWCWKISFPTRRVGFVAVESYDPRATPTHCLKTEDGGRTWTEIPLSSQLSMQGIGFATEELGWVGGLGETEQTTDGGLTWAPASWGERLNRIRFLSPTLGYASGETIYKYSEPSAVVPRTMTEVKRLWR